MNFKLPQDIKWLERIIQGILILSTILFLLSPDYFFFKKSMEFANYILVLIILCGLIFLILDSKRLVITTFLCAGTLALFLKVNTSNIHVEKNIENINPLQIAIIDLAKIESGQKEFIKTLDSINYHIYLFQNCDSNWLSIIDSNISVIYDNYFIDELISTSVLAVYSRLPIREIETLLTYDVPVIQAIIDLDAESSFMFFGLSLPVPESKEGYIMLQDVLATISNQIDDCIPVLCAGDYNLVPWSKEIQNFKSISNMKGTVHKIYPFPIFKSTDRSYRPTFHILHNVDFVCLDFDHIMYENNIIGVHGKYQIKNEHY